jgi:hypothetical protein
MGGGGEPGWSVPMVVGVLLAYAPGLAMLARGSKGAP